MEADTARSTCCAARASRSCSSTAMAAPSWCSVGVDDVEGGALAVTHLCEQGHQRIAFVGGPMSTVQVADRLRGARQAMAASGRAADSLLVLETAALNVAEGRRAGERIAGLPSRPPTDGGVLRQRPPRPRPAPADDPASASMCPASWRSWATTTSSSRPRRPCRSARCASHASCSATPPPSCCFAESDADEAHVHQQVLFHPELVVRASSISAPTAQVRGRPAASRLAISSQSSVGSGMTVPRRPSERTSSRPSRRRVEHAGGDGLDEAVADHRRLGRPATHRAFAGAGGEPARAGHGGATPDQVE